MGDEFLFGERLPTLGRPTPYVLWFIMPVTADGVQYQPEPLVQLTCFSGIRRLMRAGPCRTYAAGRHPPRQTRFSGLNVGVFVTTPLCDPNFLVMIGIATFAPTFR
jgi:hypothetical protein